MKQQLIGTTEHIYLPDLGEVALPAKIDTGADSSAIWASDIEQIDGTVFYTLFAPGSTYYTGKRHNTKKFRITSIKNSFGHEEVRYKVLLKATIGKTTITRWFSLANRSQNNFPILLGKNFLKNRFVVDVAQNYMHSKLGDTETMLVITAEPEKMKEFLNEVQESNEQNVTYKTIRFDSLLFDINGRTTTVINTLDEDSINGEPVDVSQTFRLFPGVDTEITEQIQGSHDRRTLPRRDHERLAIEMVSLIKTVY